MTEIITMSSKGQIVIPKGLRSMMGLGSGNNFLVAGKDDTIILRRIDTPSAKDLFEDVQRWGMKKTEKEGWKENIVPEKINEYRNERKKRS